MKNRILVGVIFFLLLTNVSVLWYYHFLISPKLSRITFLDVGQGSGTLVQSESGKVILIDTGITSQGMQSMTSELGFFNKNVDVIILTHYDRDHAGKAPYILKNYNSFLLFDTGVLPQDASQRGLFDEIQKQYEKEDVVKESLGGDDYIFIEENLQIRVLFPWKDLDVDSMKSNHRSLVLQLFFMHQDSEHKVLITGDLPQKYEKILVERYGESLQSDILVAGHHGSKTSSSQIFLETVRPKYFIISSGENSYGHPTSEVLSRANSINAKILRTDREGSISFEFLDQLFLETSRGMLK